MIVKNISIVNFKAISQLNADFQGGVYLITGENEFGKTTLLEAINTLLSGERTDNLLKKGETKGSVTMNVGDDVDNYKVELRITEANPRGTLVITGKNGMQSNRISMLQQLFNYTHFDAHEFVSWSESAEGRRKQIEIVLSLLPHDVQTRILEIDAKTAELKESRKPLNQESKSYRDMVDKIIITPDELLLIEDYSATDISALVQKMSDASSKNEKRSLFLERLDEKRSKLTKLPDEKSKSKTTVEHNIEILDTQIAELTAQKEACNKKLEVIDADYSELEKILKMDIQNGNEWLDINPKIEIEIIQTEIQQTDKKNAILKKSKEKEDWSTNANNADKAILDANTTIEALQNERAELIKTAQLPIDGLSFNEDGLTLGGIPFRHNEVSTSQEMEVAMKLIVAKNPTVKVFKIGQGESLGSKRLQAIVDFADKHGYQGFIEQVERGQEELKIEQYQEN